MFKIAICDDEPAICIQLENLIDDLWKDIAIEYEINTFSTGTALCQALKADNYTIVFQDIELPDKNGVAIGRYIREELNNETIQIAYISAKERYAMKLFEFRPIDFLIKPLDKKKVKKLLDKLLKITLTEKPLFTYYTKKSGTCTIPFSQIQYFQSNLRKIRMVTTNSEEIFYDTIENIYETAQHNHFLYIHKSTLVNYHYIKTISTTQVTMTDGSIFPISQARRTEIKNIYQQIRKGER